MAEIEVVADPKPQQNGDSSRNPNRNHGAPVFDLVVDVWSAAAYGDLEKLRGFVERNGLSVSNPDGNGYYPLQLAALNNFPNIAQYIIEHGGDVNASDLRKQTALHWAAVHGSIPVADVLVQNGARVEAADINGYRAVHVAAQYGQTSFLNHIIVKYGADFDAPDNDGRSPLHWAAYKGYADTIRLLLFRDSYQGRQDVDGCTPLHWAALSSNVEACTVLVHVGNKSELLVRDKKGFTPAELAANRGHRHAAYVLTNAAKINGGVCKDRFCAGRFLKNGYAPILLFVIIILMVLFLNSIMLGPSFPKVTAVVGLWGWIGLSLAVGSLIMFYRCSSKDPGFIKPDSGKSSHASDPLLDIDLNNSVWIGNWSQLCATCKIIRPVRSKHCPYCMHCVEQFDHHCPWISNCVGKKNRWDFFVFVCLSALSTFVGAVIAVHRLWTWSPIIPPSEKWMRVVLMEHPGAVLFLVMDTIVLSGALSLAVVQASQIARNITTNESANSARYSYLRGPDGRFRNPYNHGCRKNCTDFLIYGYISDNEIAWPSLQQAAPLEQATR
ncbi:putative protein S-acyltransferase 23 [Canna indica]|uniref:S-acyltransferase n=1 Tax=Canna indica TaxID=4628 RepID=A0AAQ3JLX2_9LILI|nr:putative protein S-acyltransferase 23 [Canna indica]